MNNSEMINQFFDEIDTRGWFQAFFERDGKGYCSIDMRKEDGAIKWIFANQARDGQTDRYRWTVRTVDGLVNVYAWKI